MSGDLFNRAAYWMGQLADIYSHAIVCDDGSEDDEKNKADLREIEDIETKLAQLNSEWDSRVGFDGATNAAHIVSDMLRDWKLPGTVWYEPTIMRFRVVGEGYKPTPNEICCGTYMQDAPVEFLADDFKNVINSAEKRL